MHIDWCIPTLTIAASMEINTETHNGAKCKKKREALEYSAPSVMSAPVPASQASGICPVRLLRFEIALLFLLM